MPSRIFPIREAEALQFHVIEAIDSEEKDL